MALMSSGVLVVFEAEPAAAEQQQRGRATMAALVEDMARAGAAFVGGIDVAPGMGRAGGRARSAAGRRLGRRRCAVDTRCDRRRAATPRTRAWRRPWRPGSRGSCSSVRATAARRRRTCRFAAGDDVILTDFHGAFALADGSSRVAASGPRSRGAAGRSRGRPAHGCRPSKRTATRCARPGDRPGAGGSRHRRRAGDRAGRLRRALRGRVAASAARCRRCARRPTALPERTTFGPMPPATRRRRQSGVAARGRTASSRATRPVERVATGRRLAAGGGRAHRAVRTTGPWCPSPAAPTRWDADLARVVGVRVRTRRGGSVGRGCAPARRER